MLRNWNKIRSSSRT